MAVNKPIHLEKNTQAFIEKLASQNAPPLYTLTPDEAREVLEQVQNAPIKKQNVQIEEKEIPGGPNGNVPIRIIRPENVTEKLPAIIFIHGAGWVMGSYNTHDHLARELAIGSKSAVIFVNYQRSPEAQYPVAIEESYAVTKYIAEHGKEFNIDSSHLAIVGDSVGGNMTIAVTLLAKERHGPKIDFQVLFYPVTSAELNTQSYQDFANGPWLTKPAMEWFWKAYEPNQSARKKPLLSPLQASIDQLKGLPPALVITAENDVLRDEGEAFAHHLMQAGVEVTATRFLGTIHDFVMLNALANTPAARGAIRLANCYLHRALHPNKNGH